MVTRDFHKQSLMGIFLSYFRPHMKLFLLLFFDNFPWQSFLR